MKKIKNKNKIILFSLLIIPLILIGSIYLFNENLDNSYYYDFEDDKIGSFPDSFVKHPRSLAVEVVRWNIQDGHFGKVAKLAYMEEIEDNGMELNTLYKQAKRGFVEFDVYPEYVVNRIYLDVCQEDIIYDPQDDIAIRMTTKDGFDLVVQNRYGFLEKALLIRMERWYHFRIDFDVYNGWDLNVSDSYNEFSNHYDYYHRPDYFSQVYFGTYKIGTIFYVDNVRIMLSEFY